MMIGTRGLMRRNLEIDWATIAQKRDAEKWPWRQEAEIVVSPPNPRHGDYAVTAEWPLFARFSEAPSSIVRRPDWLAGAAGFEPLHFGIRSASVDHGLRFSLGMRSGNDKLQLRCVCSSPAAPG